MIDKIEKSLVKVRSQKPLILCLTNFVTMEFVANSLLALGAAPIMSICDEEIEELVKVAAALYVNIGTLDYNFIGLAKKAIDIAKQYKKSIVFDPVGSGATTIRTDISKSILSSEKFIRGNSSEIMSLSNNNYTTYGVEANIRTDEVEEIAKRLSLDNHSIVVVSGSVDFITNGEK